MGENLQASARILEKIPFTEFWKRPLHKILEKVIEIMIPRITYK